MFKVLAILFALTVTTTVFAQTPTAKHSKKPSTIAAAEAKTVAANVYQCPDCHKKFTLAQAKKEGMKCSCCQTKLVALKASPNTVKKPSSKKS